MCNISVVIPGYNTPDEDWRRCVKSVLLSIGKNDEIICVDDCSSVQSRCLEMMAAEDSRVKVVRLEENGGQARARNIGFSVASGKYIAFCDSDDEVFNDIYGKCIAQAETTNADIVVYGVETVWASDGLRKIDARRDQFVGEMPKETLIDLKDGCLFNYPWNKVYRKSFLNENGIRFNERAIPREDEVFNLTCVLFRARWAIISDIGQKYYRADGTSLSRYRRYGSIPSRIVAETWEKCWHDVYSEPVPERFRVDETLLLKEDWQNIWLRDSPYSLKERLCWLLNHQQLGGIYTFFKMATKVFIRANFYVRPIRRWRIKRLYPYAEDIE